MMLNRQQVIAVATRDICWARGRLTCCRRPSHRYPDPLRWV